MCGSVESRSCDLNLQAHSKAKPMSQPTSHTRQVVPTLKNEVDSRKKAPSRVATPAKMKLTYIVGGISIEPICLRGRPS